MRLVRVQFSALNIICKNVCLQGSCVNFSSLWLMSGVGGGRGGDLSYVTNYQAVSTSAQNH